MKKTYFKPRKALDFSFHTYDIGNPVGSWQKYEDNHFLNKICELEDDKFEGFYKYHLSYTLENRICNEEAFFTKVWEVVENRIKKLKAEDPFSSYHDRHIFRIEKLQHFQTYLNRIDIWNARPSYIIIAEKDAIIQRLLDKNEKLEGCLAEYKEYDVVQKVSIHEDYFYAFLDLFIQLRRLQVPGKDRKILACDYKSPYCKLLSKYFLNGSKPISIETMNNYFVNKVDTSIKGTKIKPKDQVFQIIPVGPTK